MYQLYWSSNIPPVQPPPPKKICRYISNICVQFPSTLGPKAPSLGFWLFQGIKNALVLRIHSLAQSADKSKIKEKAFQSFAVYQSCQKEAVFKKSLRESTETRNMKSRLG